MAALTICIKLFLFIKGPSSRTCAGSHRNVESSSHRGLNIVVLGFTRYTNPTSAPLQSVCASQASAAQYTYSAGARSARPAARGLGRAAAWRHAARYVVRDCDGFVVRAVFACSSAFCLLHCALLLPACPMQCTFMEHSSVCVAGKCCPDTSLLYMLCSLLGLQFENSNDVGELRQGLVLLHTQLQSADATMILRGSCTRTCLAETSARAAYGLACPFAVP
jgi:hypothetical protein